MEGFLRRKTQDSPSPVKDYSATRVADDGRRYFDSVT